MSSILNLFQLAATKCGTDSGLLPNLYDRLPCTSDGSIDFNGLDVIGIIISNIVRILIFASGSLAVITIMVAALYYITSTGDPSRTKRAKEILINTTTGLVIILMSYAVVTFIAGKF